MSTPLTHRALRFAITARYAKPQQLFHRSRLLLRRRLLHPRSWYRARLNRATAASERVCLLRFPLTQTRRVELNLDELTEGTFTLLNRKQRLGRPINWLPSGPSRLWLYNLHYFDYAPGMAQAAHNGDVRALPALQDVVSQWMRANPVAAPVSWDAYPTSCRIVNWIKAYSLLGDRLQDCRDFPAAWRHSLFVHCRFLERHLEYDLINNHLIENARALFVGGHFFAGKHANRWRRLGWRHLEHGLDQHILADGGHEELSPMYHQAMLDLYQEIESILRQAGDSVPAKLQDRIQLMRSWLCDLLHPDGEIALLNDSTLRTFPQPSQSLGKAPEMKDGLSVRPRSGLFAFRDLAKQNYLIFDGGPLGPDHNPAHGHCDALSYELSVSGRRLIVDSGVEHYHEDRSWRLYYRGTRAHNTLVVDDTEQSEIWGNFRVARRARPTRVDWSTDRDCCYATAGHTGYLRLSGQVLHQRWVIWINTQSWLVMDHVTGRGAHDVESYIHFHPDATVRRLPKLDRESAVPGKVVRDDAVLQIVPFGADSLASYRGQTNPIQGWYAPEFGKRRPRDVWCLRRAGRLPMWMGYVLLPSDEQLALTCESVQTDRCDLALTLADRFWNVSVGTCGVRVACRRLPTAGDSQQCVCS